MRFTVFTPTYNRAYTIYRLYDSLKKQSFLDFEWLVIDDGSTDNTNTLFNKWLTEYNSFPITYIKVCNGGKHRAINKALDIAKGELFFIVDSDDFLTDNSLFDIDKVEKTIPLAEKIHFAGVCGNKGFSLENGVGSFGVIKDEYVDSTILDRGKYGIEGDKAEVFYTNVLRNYRFPEFDDEPFLTEAVVWNRISAFGLKLRFFNKIVYICEYLEDGLTKNNKSNILSSPKGFALYLSELIKFKHIKRYNIYLTYYNLFRGKLSLAKMSKYLSTSYIYFVIILLIAWCNKIRKGMFH